MKEQNILVVEDDENIISLLTEIISGEGWRAIIARDGAEALRMVNEHPPDMILLDLMIPKIDGFEVCRRIRQKSQIPIIVISARSEMEDKVKCLNLGADDYITKPFRIDELIARINAVFRRNRINESSRIESPFICDKIKIDAEKRRAFVSGKEVSLTPTEYNLLMELVTNSEKILTHYYLLQKVWGLEYSEEIEYLHVYIGHLRSKLEPDPKNPEHIISVPRVGYMFQK